MKTAVKNKKGVWYFQSTTECVYCGRQRAYRERREGPRPESEKRYEFKQDVCGTHFV